MPNIQSILERLNRRTELVDDCKIWIGALCSNGHGKIWFERKTVLVHRLSAHLFLEFDLNSNFQINHKRNCTSPACWNPEHIYIGTQKDNMQDRRAKTTRCPKDHEYTDNNTLLIWNKELQLYTKNCRICHREREAQRRAKIA